MKVPRIVLALTIALSAIVVSGAAQSHADMLSISGCQPGDVVHRLTPTLYSIEPRPGFDPGTASDVDLACYGFPPRPPKAMGGTGVMRDAVAASAASWTTEIHAAHYVVPVLGKPQASVDGFDVNRGGATKAAGPIRRAIHRRTRSLPRGLIQADLPNAIWAGYDMYNSDNGYKQFVTADAQWTVPYASFGPGGTGQGVVSAWVGLGGDNGSNVIWQAGTDTVVDPFVEFWFENYGCEKTYGYNPPPPCSRGTDYNGNPGGAPGYPVYPLEQPAVNQGDRVRVYVNAFNGQYFFANLSTNQSSNVHSTAINNNSTDLSADFIVEENNCDSSCTYGSATDANFTNAVASSSDGDTRYLENWTYRRQDICDNGRVISSETGVDPTAHGFHITIDPSRTGANC